MIAPDLMICGSLTLDNVVTADGRPLPQTCGGNVVYAALGARLWGARVGLVSRAGSDFSPAFLDGLAALDLDLGGIVRIDAPHGMNVAFAYRQDGSRVRAFPPELMARLPARFIDYTTLGTAHRFSTWLDFAPDAADIPAAWCTGVGFIHCAAMPVQRHLSLAARLRAARPDQHIQVDSPWYDERTPQQDFHSALLHDIDLLLPSEADLSVWRPGGDPIAVAAGLAAAAQRRVVVKRGEAGCVLLDPHGRVAIAVPACKVRAVDPTGAGDAFGGGVLAGLYRFGDLARALVCGTVSASFAVEGEGISRLETADAEEAERRFARVTSGLRGLEAS